MTSPAGRRFATYRTATPVTNIASVESMNGAPRIAPTPMPCDADEPPPVRIAMIGIIVSGRAVPTAARTEPTAPSASWSFRPNHSMPFVNSSAPARMTTKATARIRRSTSALDDPGDRHAQRDHDQDQAGHDRHVALAAPDVAHERRRDSCGRGRHDRDQPQPDEAGGLEGRDLGRDPPDIETAVGRAWAQARTQQEEEPDREEGDREVGPDREEPRDGGFEIARYGRPGGRHRILAGRVGSVDHAIARCSICHAV